MASGPCGGQDSGLRRAPALSQRRAEAATLNPWAPRTQGPRTVCLKPASPLGLHTRGLQLQDFGAPGTEGGRVSVSS